MSRPLRAVAGTGAWIALTLGLLELASLALLTLHPGWPARAEIQETLHAPAPKGEGDLEVRAADIPQLRDFVLHPYLGFVRNREQTRHKLNSRVIEEPVNEHGFFGPSPLKVPAEDELVVAITGGSVASEFFVREGTVLHRELVQHGVGGGRGIRLVSLAIVGMKQPQQVQALAYFLTLGAHFDVLINIDGFNEVVLPFIDNLPLGVPVEFPRNWKLYAAKALDGETVALAGRLAVSREESERWRNHLDGFPLRQSSLVLAVWHVIRRAGEEERAVLELALRERVSRAEAEDQALDEPLPEAGIDPEALRDAVDLWQRSTVVLEALCRAHGIAYLHVLQPSQYFPGRRVFNEREQRAAIAPPDYEYRVAAETGYPQLVEAAHSLAAAGHPLIDGTDVVADEPGSIYSDICCHLTRRGNELLAEAIAEALAKRGDPNLLWNSHGNHQLFDLSAEGAKDRDLGSRDPVDAETRGALEALRYLE